MHFIFFVGGGGGVTPTINYLSTQGEYQTPRPIPIVLGNF